MKYLGALTLSILAMAILASAQTPDNPASFQLALPDQQGQLTWRAEGFKIVQSSAKPNGDEIGIRATNDSGLSFLVFLFSVPQESSLSSAKCRDNELAVERKDPTFEISGTSEMDRPGSLTIALANYSHGSGKKTYLARAFVASSNVCGDMEFYSSSRIDTSDPRLATVLSTFHLDPTHVPQFHDVFLYAEELYRTEQYAAAAPLFERALTMLGQGKDQQMEERVLTDQAGMAYGISGNTAKAREIFSAAIARDPDYPCVLLQSRMRGCAGEQIDRRARPSPGGVLTESERPSGRTDAGSNERRFLHTLPEQQGLLDLLEDSALTSAPLATDSLTPNLSSCRSTPNSLHP